jgi:regulator of replication initiation timing
VNDSWTFRIEPVDKRVQDLQAQVADLSSKLVLAQAEARQHQRENDRLRAQLAQAGVETRP